MIYTLFFSRMRELDEDLQAEYAEHAAALRALAAEEHPGFVDLKTYTAADGERLSVARFRDRRSQDAWRRESTHVEAQQLGRSVFYDEYRVVVCEPFREHAWHRSERSESSTGEGA